MDRALELAAVIKCLGDTDDALNQLVRFHALTELYLDVLISHGQSVTDKTSKKSFVPYSRKLNAVEENELLSPSLCISLRQLTALRNEFSHNPFPEVTVGKLGEIVKPFPERVRGVRKVLPDDTLTLRQVSMVVFIELTTHFWDKDEHEEVFANYTA